MGVAESQTIQKHSGIRKARKIELGAKLVLLGLALLSFFIYPGHTFLESDSQIFMPALLHMQDHTLYRNDIVLEGPHTTYTLYDELVRALNYITGIRHELLLFALQVLFRFLGLLGIFWLLAALELERPFALLGAGLYGLGATVLGPSVLTVEYEPVPRAFALPLVLLGLGLVGRGRYIAAGVAGTAAFLLHPPTAAAFWFVYLVCLFANRAASMSERLGAGGTAPSEAVKKSEHSLKSVPLAPQAVEVAQPSGCATPAPAAIQRFFHSFSRSRLRTNGRLKALAPLVAGVALLVLFARLETGAHEPQSFFVRIDAEWEKLQRLRAPYVWTTLFPKVYFWLYGCMALVLAAACWQLRRRQTECGMRSAECGATDSPLRIPHPALRTYLWMLPAIGLASVPVNYLLLEKMKWAMMPQFQPMRYLLYVMLSAMLVSYAVAITQMRDRARYLEGFLWLLAAFTIDFQPYHLFWIAPLLLGFHLSGLIGRARWAPVLMGIAGGAGLLAMKPFGIVAWSSGNRKMLGVTALFSLAVVLLVWLFRRRPSLAAAGSVILVAAFFLAAPLGGRRSSLGLVTPELLELSAWAKEQTPQDAVFLFADAGRGLEPGVFRYYARRAVYVDWKTGGQVNYFRAFSNIWWRRWQATMAQPFQLSAMAGFRQLGIRYLAFRKVPKSLNNAVIFHNAKYGVVAIPAQN